jgi:hypothetical protein
VIDEFGPVIELADTTPAAQTPAIDLTLLWQQTSTDQKLDFLRQLLEKQPDIRAQLAQFAKPEPAAPQLVFFTHADNESATPIDRISTAVFEGSLRPAFR